MTTGAPAIIEARGLTRLRNDHDPPILSRVDFAIDPGERVGLVGSSGSGKSSLFRALVKLDPIDAGEVLYRGQSIAPRDIPAFRRQVIYVPQRPAFVVGTVIDNLRRPLEFMRSKNPSSHSGNTPLDYSEWLTAVSKPPSFLAQDIQSLSGGEQQIVSLLRAIQLQPDAMLLDEPTASLDPDSTAVVERLIDAWLDGNPSRACVWTSHHAEQIRRRSQRIVSMHAGRVSV